MPLPQNYHELLETLGMLEDTEVEEQRKSAPFKLNERQIDSELWKVIEEGLNTRLDMLRKLNDRDLDSTQTAKLRGQIEECQAFLEIGRKESIDLLTEEAGETPTDNLRDADLTSL